MLAIKQNVHLPVNKCPQSTDESELDHQKQLPYGLRCDDWKNCRRQVRIWYKLNFCKDLVVECKCDIGRIFRSIL